MYGIFDGHGGHDCAQYITDELPAKITQILRNNNKSIPDSLYQSFLLTDSLFLKSMSNSTAGSTATVLLWETITQTAYIANTGDTRAVLCRQNIAIDLTKDRKATDPEEIARILYNKGYITHGRVQGTLAIARAFGDKQLKDFGPKILTVEPEITILDINSDIDEFIVIATDGLWDVMTSQQVITIIKEMLIKANLLNKIIINSNDIIELNKICDYLTNYAIKTLGSLDNVTVMILLFTKQTNQTNNQINQTIKTKELHNIKYILNNYSINPINIEYSNEKSNEKLIENTNLNLSEKLITKMKTNSFKESTKSIKINENNGILIKEKISNENESINDSNIHQNQQKTMKKHENVDDLLDFLMDDKNF